MAISIVPIFLSEISSHKIRGQTGTLNELAICSGIVFSQILGFSQLLGAENLWNILLAGPAVPAIISTVLLFFLPDSPKAILLMNKKNGQEEARKGLLSFQKFISVN
jgi:hypothetical protein